jgi:hypothetical protein
VLRASLSPSFVDGTSDSPRPGDQRGKNGGVSAVEWNIMQVTIQLPEDISAALEEQWDDVPRRSLEAIAVEAYRTGALNEPQVRRLPGLDTRFEVHALLKEHHVPLHYTSADVEDDLRAQRELGILPGR